MTSQFESRNQLETVEQKRKHLDFDISKSNSGESTRLERAFADLSSELSPKHEGEKYDVSDIGDAISKRFDASIQQKTQNLNDFEKAELLKIKQEILSTLAGKHPKQMLEAFADLRDKLYGIIAASDGKSGQKDKKLEQVQQAQKTEEGDKYDAFAQLKALLEKNEQIRIEREMQAKAKKNGISKIENRDKEQESAGENLDIALRTLA